MEIKKYEKLALKSLSCGAAELCHSTFSPFLSMMSAQGRVIKEDYKYVKKFFRFAMFLFHGLWYIGDLMIC